ncbi:MAG: DUF1415 domain-containing protein [Immundisolibacteraceae bacterium]|nr:DUF1415 domain-containing protein [Immundisolibacteraceae bacterium]
MNTEQIVTITQNWVEQLVVGLNLCPFARAELVNQRIRFEVTQATDESGLLVALKAELLLLDQQPGVETSLLIHPQAVTEFGDYNQFLNLVDDLVEAGGWQGVYQVASFHPDYQFGGTEPGDAENYTNRSPYPMLHLLREASLERAIEDFGDTEQIPERNIELLEQIGSQRLAALLAACFDSASG